MTINKAIEILTDMGTPKFRGYTEDILAARKLGIEALEQLQKERKQKVGFWRDRLSGETEE